MAVTVDEAKKRLGRKIIRAREAAGLNQRELAERLVGKLSREDAGSAKWHRDVASMQRNLRRYENGHNVPRGVLLMLIAAETETEASHFTSSDDDDEEDDPEVRLRRVVSELVTLGKDDLAGDLLRAMRELRERS